MGMADVFLYVNREEAPDILSCGLKLAEKYDCIIEDNGMKYKAIRGYLNPADKKFINSAEKDNCVCMRAEIYDFYCRIGDGDIYNCVRPDNDCNNLFAEGLIPYKFYTIGYYRNPIAFITASVLSEQIFMQGDKPDIPILYTESEDYYVDRIFNQITDIDEKAKDKMLYLYFLDLHKRGFYDIKKDDKNGKLIFFNKEMNLYFVVRDYCV